MPSPPETGTSVRAAIAPVAASYATSPRYRPSSGRVTAYNTFESASSSMSTTSHSGSAKCLTSSGAGLAADTAYDETVPLNQFTYSMPPAASRAMSPAANDSAPAGRMDGFACMSSDPARV